MEIFSGIFVPSLFLLLLLPVHVLYQLLPWTLPLPSFYGLLHLLPEPMEKQKRPVREGMGWESFHTSGQHCNNPELQAITLGFLSP